MEIIYQVILCIDLKCEYCHNQVWNCDMSGTDIIDISILLHEKNLQREQ